MQFTRLKNYILIALVFWGGVLLTPRLVFAADTATVEELEKQINELKSQLQDKRASEEDLSGEIDRYQKELTAKQREVKTLQEQLDVIGTQIKSTQLTITKTQTDIEVKQLEVERLQLETERLQLDIADKKQSVAELLRELARSEDQNQIAAFLANTSLSEYFDQQRSLTDMHELLQDRVVELVQSKQESELKTEYAKQKQASLERLSEKLVVDKNQLEEQESVKTIVLDQTTESEEKYQQLIAQVKQEQTAVSADIQSLEAKARESLNKISEQKGDTDTTDQLIEILGDAVLQWPLPAANRRITAYFHDPTYPYRNVFAHPAIDIAAPQGTAIYAAADGVVGVARNIDWIVNGEKRYPAYNYVLIAHKGDISTLYGHLSKVSVSVGEVVKKGQVIGLTGGKPGSAGAGLLTTGSHLHFEVRVNGIPADPLGYLPK